MRLRLSSYVIPSHGEGQRHDAVALTLVAAEMRLSTSLKWPPYLGAPLGPQGLPVMP